MLLLVVVVQLQSSNKKQKNINNVGWGVPRPTDQTSCKSKFIVNFICVYLCLSVDNIKTKHFRKNSINYYLVLVVLPQLYRQVQLLKYRLILLFCVGQSRELSHLWHLSRQQAMHLLELV